jgi:septal ring factor EnvC (AmiA/AmiB activator)
MAEKIQFTEEEMKSIDNLQKSYKNLQDALGQTSVARIRLEQQLNELDKTEDNIKDQYAEIQSTERNFVDSINKKYGDGNLDLNSGIFTPKSETENTNKTL